MASAGCRWVLLDRVLIGGCLPEVGATRLHPGLSDVEARGVETPEDGAHRLGSNMDRHLTSI